jgi:hypothetical protein
LFFFLLLPGGTKSTIVHGLWFELCSALGKAGKEEEEEKVACRNTTSNTGVTIDKEGCDIKPSPHTVQNVVPTVQLGTIFQAVAPAV